MADVNIRFLGDSKDVEQAVRQVRGDVDDLDDRLDKSSTSNRGKFAELGTGFKTLVGGAVAGTVIQVGRELDQLATKMEATERRADTVFGEMAGQAKQWADDHNEAFGIGESALLDLEAKVGDLLVPMGFARDEAFDLTTEILNTANALSEWSGGSIDARDATDKITKALLGERDGLVELGVKLSDADLKQQRMKDGTEDLTGAAGQQADAMATLELITGKSADALAAYEDRAGTALAATKELEASAEDTAETWAEMLKPSIDRVKGSLADSAAVAEGVSGAIADMTGTTEENRAQVDLWGAVLDGLTLGTFPALERDLALTAGLFEENEEAIDEMKDSGSSAGEVVVKKVTPAIDGWAASLEDARDRLKETEEAQESLTDQQRAAVDPLFNLIDKTRSLEAAQLTYNEALEEHGPKSQEAEDAAYDLAEAQLELNGAAETWAEEGGAHSVDALKELLEQAGLSTTAIREIIGAIEDLNNTPITHPVTGKNLGHNLGHSGPVIGYSGGDGYMPVGGAGTVINLTVNGYVGSERELAAELDRLLTRRGRITRLGFV